MPFQASGADLRPLQVLQDADRTPFALGRAAQPIDVLGVIFVRPMGKIQAGDVHAQAQQVAHAGLRVAGGTDGADDLGATADMDWRLAEFGGDCAF